MNIRELRLASLVSEPGTIVGMKFDFAQLPLDNVVVNDLVEKIRDSFALNDVALAQKIGDEIEDDKIILSVWIKLTTPSEDNDYLINHDRWFEKMKFVHKALIQRTLKCFGLTYTSS